MIGSGLPLLALVWDFPLALESILQSAPLWEIESELPLAPESEIESELPLAPESEIESVLQSAPVWERVTMFSRRCMCRRLGWSFCR